MTARRGSRLAGRLALAAAVVAGAPNAESQQEPQVRIPEPFPAAVDVVTADVSIRDGNVPVVGLGADDLVVTDNGVAQSISVFPVASLPVDITFLIDTSGSMGGDLDAVLAQVRDAAALVEPGDRIRTLTVAYDVRTGRFESASGRQPIDPPPAWGATALIDGLAMALMNARVEERRHLVVAYTDGYDNFSALSLEDLNLISRRSDSVLHVLQVINTGELRTTDPRSPFDLRNRWRPPRAHRATSLMAQTLPLGPIARNTGGDIRSLGARGDSVAAIREIIDLFRSSYVVAYRITGVELPGWHDIQVDVVGHDGLAVRHRVGYFIGADGR